MTAPSVSPLTVQSQLVLSEVLHCLQLRYCVAKRTAADMKRKRRRMGAAFFLHSESGPWFAPLCLMAAARFLEQAGGVAHLFRVAKSQSS